MTSRLTLTRRDMLAAGAATMVGTAALADDGAAPERGKIKQSVCQWCYGGIPIDKLAAEAAKIGYRSIELLSPEQYRQIKPFGLTCAMVRCKSITDGLNRKENHDAIEKELRENIDFAAAEKLPNVICMSGNRRGMSDDEGIENCVAGLKRVIGHAEKQGVAICMEGLNSKVDHRDYMFDRTEWGVKLCQKLGSPRFKLLYDIYHMQIMEGDVIRTIRKHKDHIGHYHTGGVPGRNEIDDKQELHYPAIVNAILETGYTGYLGQEFIPKREPMASLAECYRICNV